MNDFLVGLIAVLIASIAYGCEYEVIKKFDLRDGKRAFRETSSLKFSLKVRVLDIHTILEYKKHEPPLS